MNPKYLRMLLQEALKTGNHKKWLEQTGRKYPPNDAPHPGMDPAKQGLYSTMGNIEGYGGSQYIDSLNGISKQTIRNMDKDSDFSYPEHLADTLVGNRLIAHPSQSHDFRRGLSSTVAPLGINPNQLIDEFTEYPIENALLKTQNVLGRTEVEPPRLVDPFPSGLTSGTVGAADIDSVFFENPNVMDEVVEHAKRKWRSGGLLQMLEDNDIKLRTR